MLTPRRLLRSLRQRRDARLMRRMMTAFDRLSDGGQMTFTVHVDENGDILSHPASPWGGKPIPRAEFERVVGPLEC